MTADLADDLAPGEVPSGADALLPALWRSREVRWSATSGLLIAAGYLAGPVGAPGSVSTVLFIVAALVGARFFAAEAIEELVTEREIGIELLMTVAAVVAGVLGAWSEAAALAFLYSISESLEEFTEDRTRDAIAKLLDLAPRRVTVVDADGNERDVDVDEVALGDRFLVRPGQNVATDGVVVEGTSALDEAAVTMIPAGCTEREQLIRDARSVLATADAYHALHPGERVVFFGEITRWLVKEKQTTWGELHVDFEVALAHLDHHAPNLVLDTDLVTATIIATPADRVLVAVPGGANSVPVDTAPVKQMILDVVDAEPPGCRADRPHVRDLRVLAEYTQTEARRARHVLSHGSEFAGIGGAWSYAATRQSRN